MPPSGLARNCGQGQLAVDQWQLAVGPLSSTPSIQRQLECRHQCLSKSGQWQLAVGLLLSVGPLEHDAEHADGDASRRNQVQHKAVPAISACDASPKHDGHAHISLRSVTPPPSVPEEVGGRSKHATKRRRRQMRKKHISELQELLDHKCAYAPDSEVENAAVAVHIQWHWLVMKTD